jgi:hypothetical protein
MRPLATSCSGRHSTGPVGPFTLLKRGTDAVIEKGMPFTGFVSTETASNNGR